MEKIKATQANDTNQLKLIQKQLTQVKREAKRKYKSETLDEMASNIKKAWSGIKKMSHVEAHTPSIADIVPENNQKQLANELNTYYCRFESTSDGQANTINCLNDQPPFTTKEVLTALKKAKPGKSSGPDKIPTTLLNKCAAQMAQVLTPLFNKCLCVGVIPDIWKMSNIVPIPKVKNPGKTDYRPIALTSTIMKCLEHLIKDRVLQTCHQNMDEYQYAYKSNRSTKDACAVLDFMLRKHLDTPGNYARVMFVDFTSAFNTISPPLLLQKLKHLGVPDQLNKLIQSFLYHRSQRVRVGTNLSENEHTNTGCPQGCVLSPLLFSLYTNEVQSDSDNIKVLKYADDMAILGLCKHNNSESFYHDYVRNFSIFCEQNKLLINSKKTKEMILNFSRSIETDHILSENPLFINDTSIDCVNDFKYLGTVFNHELKWKDNSKHILSKLRQRRYAFYKFCSFGANESQKLHFIKSLLLPIFMYNAEIWFCSSTNAERDKFNEFFSNIGFYDNLQDKLHECILKFSNHITSDDRHVLNSYFVPGRRCQYISMKCKTNRLRDSFLPFSIRCHSTHAYIM